jgi:phosphonate transport system permease protein
MKQAANETYKLPPALFHARSRALWFAIGVVALVAMSFATLDLQWAKFLSADALRRMGHFIGELLVPDTRPAFLRKLLTATLETLAISALGT